MKIYLDSIGCRLNQSEIEAYAWQFGSAGNTLVLSPEEADLAVINTCTVTAAAESDSRQKIRQVRRAGARSIVVTGCWSTLNPESAAALPGVELLVTNQDKDQLVWQVLQERGESAGSSTPCIRPVMGAHMRTRAFVKVQDGCDNRCTYCITALARGASRSRPMEEILQDVQHMYQEMDVPDAARQAAVGRLQEVVLTGVHLGAWGMDLTPPLHLKNLLQAILDRCDIPRLRLSSLEPWDLADDFFSLWQDSRLCRHLHLPLQSGSPSILRRMARKTTPEAYARLVASARNTIPEVAITTDVIVGFPGETEQEFNESLEFIKEMQFARGHVFTYSARPGTAAAKMENQVPFKIRKERNHLMQQVLDQSARVYQGKFIGKILPVLWEGGSIANSQGWQLSGLTDNYIRVSASSPKRLWNQITPVRLVELGEQGLLGEICESNVHDAREQF
jgi:threonylcarbamoyladenosine tRNA methylthiotransferase MtaB